MKVYDTNGATVLGTPVADAGQLDDHQRAPEQRRPQPDRDADRH